MAGSLAFPPEFHIGVPRWLNLVALLGSYGFTQMLASERHALVNHKWALWFMNVVPVRILVRGEPATAQGLVVANHTSWLDPIVLAHQEPLRFVTSSDTAEHRFLGWISRLAGCHFVSRKAWTLPEELKALQKGLDNLGRFALFPEATSSNGETILPFRPSLFEIAMRAQVPV
ncbi:MAG TPA: lysophospholipid acyltransferase family protein, partial [Fibrobacteraceae bacterium]|nr:lysophospholipid acyltransferase family protein [Fibrobacteraceae bacterium]